MKQASAWLMAAAFGTLLAAPPAQAADELKLATARNCMTCHTVERRVVGPSYKSVAQKYRNDPAAVDKLAPLIRAGGSGSFGTVPMPASPQLTDAEARRLTVWILGLK